MTDLLDHGARVVEAHGLARQNTSNQDRGLSGQSKQDSWVDGEDARPFKTWTREEAEALRAQQPPPLSPWWVVAAQAAAGLLCFLLALVLFERSSIAWSALYGAAVAVLPAALLARGMTRGTRNPLAAAAGFMFWEMLKIGVAIAMLAIAVKAVPHLSWPALLVTMVVCIKVNWVALLWRNRRVDKKAKQQDGS